MTAGLRSKIISTVTGTGLGEAVIVVGAIPLAIIFSPADLGEYGALTAIAGIFGLALTLSFELAIPTATSDADAGELALLGLGSCVAVAAFGVGIAFLATEFVSVPNRFSSWVLQIACMTVSIATFELGAGVSIRKATYRQLAVARAVRGVVQVATQVLAGILTDWGVTGLVLGLIVGRSVPSAFLLHPIYSWVTNSSALGILRMPQRLFKKYREFPVFSMPAQVAMLAGVQAPMVLTPVIFGTDLAGQLFLARRILAGPTGVLARSLGYVYFGESAATKRTGEPARGLFIRVLKLTLAGGLVIAAGAIAGGWYVVPLVLGSEWSTAGVLLAVLAPVYALQIAASPLSRTFQVFDGQAILFRWSLLRLGAVLATFGAIAWFEISFVGGMALVALTLTGGHIVQIYQAWNLLTTRRTHLSTSSQPEMHQ